MNTKSENTTEGGPVSNSSSTDLLAAAFWIARLECPHCGDWFKHDGSTTRYCGECTEKMRIPPASEDFAAQAAKKLFEGDMITEEEAARIIRDAAFRSFR